MRSPKRALHGAIDPQRSLVTVRFWGSSIKQGGLGGGASTEGVLRLVLYCKQMPFIRHTLQGFDSAILERQARTSDEVLHGTRYEHFPRICKSSHTRPNVDGNAPELITHDFAFAGV